MEKRLLTFTHGLGDAVQFTAVLKHLKKYRPDWLVDVGGLIGKHSCWQGLCRQSLILDGSCPNKGIDPSEYDQVLRLDWPECDTFYADSPSTKTCRTLREIFDLNPDADLLNYQINYSAKQTDRAEEYLQQITNGRKLDDGRFPVVAIHYEGNTSVGRKNLSHDNAANLCRSIREAGYVPMILDWDRRSPLPDQETIFCPDVLNDLWKRRGTGDGAQLAALIDRCSLFVGIDSGPQKVAGATTTPKICVWTGHHPLHFWDLSPALHLVPASHRDWPTMQNGSAKDYFTENYSSLEYHNIDDMLAAVVRERLQAPRHPEWTLFAGMHIRGSNIEQDICVIKDVLEGDTYRVSGISPLNSMDEIVVDVGAHIGCFARRWRNRDRRSRIFCIEACPENLPLLEANVGGFATVVPAACTYESNVALLNAVYENCVTTGGSIVVSRETLAETEGYWPDERELPTVTLEQLLHRYELPRIDLLKLDCEGSEFSILDNCKDETLERIGEIVGEVHGLQRFREEIVEKRFQDWQFQTADENEQTIFWLANPRRKQFAGSLV